MRKGESTGSCAGCTPELSVGIWKNISATVRLLELITEGLSLIAKDSPYILNYDYDYASEKERDFEPPPLEYQILLTYSITDTVTKDMESCFNTDCQETYNQTPVSFTFITPETEKLFRPENYPERFSRWFEKFVEHVTYNL